MKLTEKQEQWLAALESGRHKQCTQTLHDGTGYCCLGLAELVCFSRTFTEYPTGFWIESEGYLESSEMLPPDFKSLGLRDEKGDLDKGHLRNFEIALENAGYSVQQIEDRPHCLAAFNDDGATFAQIAAAIRAVPEAVFV